MLDKKFHLSNINRIINEKVGDVYFPIVSIEEKDGVVIVENMALPTDLSYVYLLDDKTGTVYHFIPVGDSVKRYFEHLAGVV